MRLILVYFAGVATPIVIALFAALYLLHSEQQVRPLSFGADTGWAPPGVGVLITEGMVLAVAIGVVGYVVLALFFWIKGFIG